MEHIDLDTSRGCRPDPDSKTAKSFKMRSSTTSAKDTVSEPGSFHLRAR